MKRYICLIISLCLVLGSFSFVFASATSWDTSDQTNLSNAASRLYYNGYSAAYYLKQIADRVAVLSTISSDISTIKGYLYDDYHSIGYWTSSIASWMQPIYNSIINSVSDTDIEPIISGLNEVVTSGGSTSYTPFLKYNNKSAANYLYDFNNYFLTSTGRTFSGWVSFNSDTSAGLYSGIIGVSPFSTALITALGYINNNTTRGFNFLYSRGINGYNGQQTATNWGNLGTSTFTPVSSTDGIYKWLSAIQTPVARLSYVLASDQRIDAQEAAALAEQEVVDNFIDPAGDSSATASDFGSISDLSYGYQQNFGSTASVSGIFDIFDSNNFGWFSSETYNQLDTTVAQRGSSFETPLLDQQLDDISRALGVDYAN